MSEEPHHRSRTRMTVAEAARALGISEGAVHQRVERGELEHEHTPNGRLIVYLDSAVASAAGPDRVRDGSHDAKTERHARSLEDEVQYLRNELDQEREANRENSLIITALKDRITELEASQTAPVEPESREPYLSTVGPDERSEHPRVPKIPENLKNDAVWAQFFVTAGAGIVAAAVLVMSVLNGQVVLAGLAGGLTLLSILSFLSHWVLFR